jgi:hypothetical protein
LDSPIVVAVVVVVVVVAFETELMEKLMNFDLLMEEKRKNET